MKKCLVYTTLLTLCPLLLIAQPPDTLWTKTYGGNLEDRGWCVQQTIDGGYIVQGTTESFGLGGTSIYLIKTNSLGDSLWTRTYQGGYCNVSAVQQTSDSGYIILGTTDLFGSGGTDYYLVKTDAQGDTLWTKTYGGLDDELGTDGQQTFDGGYVIVGWTASFHRSGECIYLVKTDSDGDSLWAKTYEGATGMPYFVQQTSDSGYIIAGQIELSSPDIYLIKTDAQGDTLWTKTYGGTAADEAWDVQETSDSGYIVVGATRSFGAGNWDFYLIKTDAYGNMLWTKTYGGGAGDASRSGHQTLDGGYIISGWTCSFGAGSYDGYAVKTDAQGDILWQEAYGGGGQDELQYIQQTSDRGYIAIGGAWSFGAGDWDVWLIRLAGEAAPYATIDIHPDVLNLKSHGKWITCYTEFSEGYSVEDIDINSVAVIAIDGDAIDPLYRSGPTDIGDYDEDGIPDLMVKFDRQALIAILRTMIEPPAYVELEVGGMLVDSAPYSGVDTIRVISPGHEPERYKDSDGKEIARLCGLRPNPFAKKTEIRYEITDMSNAEIKIYDATGCLVRQWDNATLKQSDHIFWDGTDRANRKLSNGVYFIELRTNEYAETMKLMLIRQHHSLVAQGE